MLKSRDITLPTKVCLVKAMVFPVVMYGCESWIVKKADHWRTDAFELWCWRRLLRVPWTARRSNQSILKDISPGCSLEGLVLKLKLQYFGHLMWRVDSLEKPWCWEGLGAGGIGDDRRWDGWMASPTWWAWVCVDSGSRWWTGRPGVLWFMGLQRVGHDWATELNWGRPRQPKSAEQTNRGKWVPKETIVCVFREIHWSPWISTNVCLHDVKLCEKGKKSTTTSYRSKEFLELTWTCEELTFAPVRWKDIQYTEYQVELPEESHVSSGLVYLRSQGCSELNITKLPCKPHNHSTHPMYIGCIPE